MLETLDRTTAARIKSDGENCSHLMHDIGMPDEEGYREQLQIARSDAVVIPMPTDMEVDHFKERCYIVFEVCTHVSPIFSRFSICQY